MQNQTKAPFKITPKKKKKKNFKKRGQDNAFQQKRQVLARFLVTLLLKSIAPFLGEILNVAFKICQIRIV